MRGCGGSPVQERMPSGEVGNVGMEETVRNVREKKGVGVSDRMYMEPIARGIIH